MHRDKIGTQTCYDTSTYIPTIKIIFTKMLKNVEMEVPKSVHIEEGIKTIDVHGNKEP